jgi:hypothetical protein
MRGFAGANRKVRNLRREKLILKFVLRDIWRDKRAALRRYLRVPGLRRESV